MALVTIKRRSDFLAAAKHGKRIAASSFVLQMHRRAGTHPVKKTPRIGLTVTKKMGNAVIRNRIKRRLRAALGEMEPMLLDEHDYVIISRLKALDCPFEDIKRDMRFAFSRAGK